MLNLNDSSSDLSSGNIDENTQIRTKPSIQAIALNCQKVLERKKSQDNYSNSSRSQIKIQPRKNSSASKLIKTKNIRETKNTLSKKSSDEKTKKIFSFNKPNTNLFKKSDEDKFQSSRLQKGKANIQSFIRQIQNNCKELKSKIQTGELIKKKDSSENQEIVNFINKRVSKSPKVSKPSPKKTTPVRSPNFSFQPLKLSSTNGKIFKKPATSKSPSQSESKFQSSPKSENLLIKKFEQEFSRTTSDMDFDCTGQLNYSKFCQVLQKMYFINSTKQKTDEERELILKAWKLLGGNDYSKVSKKNLCNFLMAVSNLFKKIRSSSNDTAISGMVNGTLFLTLEDVKKIHKEFHLLYLNRKTPRLKSASKTPQKPLIQNLLTENKEPETGLASGPGVQPEQDLPDLLAKTQAAIYQTTPNKLNIKSDEAEEEYRLNFKPTLSIPKVASQKSTSLRSNSCSPETFLQRVKFSYHSSSRSQKRSENCSLHTSENENTENSLINPLVTPPSYAGKVLQFYDENIAKEHVYDKSSKRYKCQSPDSYEESEESILVTVVLPDDQEQFIRIHKEDDLNLVIREFGKTHKLEMNQLITLKQEIMQKLK